MSLLSEDCLGHARRHRTASLGKFAGDAPRTGEFGPPAIYGKYAFYIYISVGVIDGNQAWEIFDWHLQYLQS